jgi:microcystin-dependent protein
MPYNVKFTDNVNKGFIVVEDKTFNSETSLSLPGRDQGEYGTIVAENFLHLLENFANTSSPVRPVEGQLWYDTTNNANQLKLYDGTQWVSAGGLKKAATEPAATASTLGDLWINTSTQQLYLYSGSGWILVGPSDAAGTGTGALTQNIKDTNNRFRTVIVNYIDNKVISVISADQFTAKNQSDLPGFSTSATNNIIYPGINLSRSITGTGDDLGSITTNTKYYGVVSTAESLLINGSPRAAAEFAILSSANTFTAPLTVSSNDGITVGSDTKFKMSVSGSNGEIRNGASDGSIDFKVRKDGILTTALRVYHDASVVIGSPTRIPTATLDVLGDIKTAGDVNIGVKSDTTPSDLTVSGSTGIVGNLVVDGTTSISGIASINNIITSATALSSIGTASVPFANMFSDRFTGNFVGELDGNISGSAASSAKLVSPTTFQLVGDVVSQIVSFDGQVGSLTKTFNTTLSDTFFTDKDTVATSATDDQILVNRPGTGLVIVEQGALLEKIPNDSLGPLVPVGTILPFGGPTAPAGWLICNGTEYEIATYELLYEVIGASFGVSSSPTTLFKSPDMRGRSLLGALSGATGSARVVNDAAANTIGNYGGSESALIENGQLPEHTHSLQGDAGTQFYATNNNVTNPTDSASVGTLPSSSGPLTGSGITRTEGIANFTPPQEEFKTVSPFATVNFIIYHGVF